MKKVESKTLFSTAITIFIISILIMLGPANAVTISVSTQPATSGEITSFIANIDLKTSERIPFNNLSATITDEENNIVSQCFFDINAKKLNPCDDNFISIEKIRTSNYDEGERLGKGYGTNNSAPDGNYTTSFGYGYGYSDSNITDELKYNISWKTPSLKSTSKTYKLSIEADAQSSSNFFRYKTRAPADINVEIKKPVALINDTTIEGAINEEIIINASPSFDPNNLEITNYTISQGNNIITNTKEPLINFTIDFTGTRRYNLTLTNELNATSDPLTFTIIGTSDFNPTNFRLEVNRLIERGTINFNISQLKEFNDLTVKVNPKIECFDIDIEYKDRHLDTILRLRETPKTFLLNTKRLDYELKVPLNNDCTFKTTLINEETKEKITLEKDVNFVDDISKLITEGEEIDIAIDNGNELINYIYKSISTQFSPGFNSINFNFKNERRTDIEADIQLLIPDLNIQDYEKINVYSNSDSKVTIPIYITEDTSPGVYPFRITYRINEGDTKTKYGILEIAE